MVSGQGFAIRGLDGVLGRSAQQLRGVEGSALVTVAGVGYASTPRPALVVQDDRFDATDSLTICPLTTTEVAAPLLRVRVAADHHNGLERDSYLMVDKITTIRRSNARAVIGRVNSTTLVEFERRLLVFLGFGG